MASSSDYWKKRMEALEEFSYAEAESCCKDIQEQFRRAANDIQMDIELWYYRIADNNGISYAAAKKLLKKNEMEEFHWTVEQYIRAGEENAIDRSWMKELENASAKVHISRLEAMKTSIQQHAEMLYSRYEKSTAEFLGQQYKNGYYRTAFEIMKGTGIGMDLHAIDARKLDAVLAKPWAADGANFSDRIWKDKKRLVSTLHTELSQCMIRGETADKMIGRLSKAMNVSRNQTGRLIMTETAAVSSAAARECYYDLDVEQFEILATLDAKTSEICRQMDGKVFLMSDYEVGVTAPPFHPFCRSTTVPHFDDEFTEGEKRAARGEDGKTYYVPGNMTYKEWDKAFVQGDKSDLQEINPDGTIKTEEQNFDIEGNTTKLKGAMRDKDYAEYLARLNNHSNDNVKKLYSSYADKIAGVKKSSSGAYTPASNSLTFSYPDERYIQNGKDKYSTVAHEYGHFFDAQAQFSDLHFNEIDTVKNNLNYTKSRFTNRASSSDEFLAAVRKDKQFLRDTLTDEIKKELRLHDASDGVQDAIDGLLWERIGWGHGDKYYNRLYHSIKQMKEHKGLQQAYKDLGYDVSNLSKVVSICRDYESASEMWANIMAAEVDGGEALEYVKKYLPNSYAALIEILKGVK